MKNELNLFLEEYQKDSKKTVNKNSLYYQCLEKKIPEIIKSYLHNDKYIVKGSCGAGNKSEIPWICIFNSEITTTAQKRIYICYLFPKDLEGFYLTIGQGITQFAEINKSQQYENARKVAKYFQTIITDNYFSKEEIDLKSNNKYAKGYTKSNIISKYYFKNSYTDEILKEDFSKILTIYEEICEELKIENYHEIIQKIIENQQNQTMPYRKAQKFLNKLEQEKTAESFLLEEVEIPKKLPKKKYTQSITFTQSKIDYVKKAQKNLNNGLIGEAKVMEYEKRKLQQKNRPDLINQIEWVSEKNDRMGYDILSYDIDENGQERKIYIEVKSTEKGPRSPFFISKKEVETMEKEKENYYIYRVYQLKSKKPKIFILNYSQFKKRITLEIENYQAKI